MNQEQNNLNLNNFNTQGNNGIPNNQPINNKKVFFKSKKIWFLIVGIILLFIVIFTFIASRTNNRKAELVNIDEVSYVKYNYGNDELYLGKEVSSYLSQGYSYDTKHITKDDYIMGDSIAMMTFYKDDVAKFLGALYCPKNDKCTYEESILIKINFYEDESLLIDDYLKYELTYADVVGKYGKEDGRFYQNEEQLVWSFGEKGKIGEPYYVLRFNQSDSLSTSKLTDIRIGVWWYEGEFEYSVIKKDMDGVEDEEK